MGIVDISRIIRMVSGCKDFILLWLVIFIIYNINLRVISAGDALPASLLPFSILEYHNLYFDQFGRYFQYLTPGTTPYMFLENDGHYLSVYPIVLPVLITPLYVISYILMNLLNYPIDMFNPGFYAIVTCMEKLSASIIASSSAAFVYLFVRGLTGRKIALVTTSIYAFATNTWMISSQGLWQHGLAELLLSAMIYIVLLNERTATKKNVLYLGLLSGLYLFNRPTDVFLIVPIFIYVAQLGKKNVVLYLLSSVVSGAPFLAYNVHYFGSIVGGYMKDASHFDFSQIIFFNFMGLLISPNRGLLVYTPIYVLSIFGILQAMGMFNPRIKKFILISGICILMQILFYSVFSIWWAGWSYGPRFLTDSLPFMTLSLGIFMHNFSGYPVVGSKKKLWTLVIAVLLIWSLSVQVIGAFCFNYQWDADQGPGKDPDRYWNFTDTQIGRAIHSGPVNVNPMATLSTIFALSKDIIYNPSDQSIKIYLNEDSGWYHLEDWEGVPTRWISNDASLQVHSIGVHEVTLRLKALSFRNPRTLEIYANGDRSARALVPSGFANIHCNIILKDGSNFIRFHVVEDCDMEGQSKKNRCLSIAFQDITMK